MSSLFLYRYLGRKCGPVRRIKVKKSSKDVRDSLLFCNFAGENHYPKHSMKIKHWNLLVAVVLLALFAVHPSLFVSRAAAQVQVGATPYKVKKKETIFSIAREHGLTVEQLVNANPGMDAPGYKLKKGSTILIPQPAADPAVQPAEQPAAPASQRTDVRQRAIRMGVMLPLHKQNNDGRRMIEYYRGLLMACDSMKKEGISVDVFAWNVAEESDIRTTLADPDAARCDIIVGPLYSKFVGALSDFVTEHDIRLVIPFSINAPQLAHNSRIFQVYQAPAALNDVTARRVADWFKDCHPIIVDCGDTTSTKGPFTAALRKIYETRGVQYSLTSLKSTDVQFGNAFVKDKPNVVVLNTARSQELNATFGKLSALIAREPEVQLALFGYTEWMMYLSNYQLNNFYRYNVYIPAHFYTNLQSTLTERLQQKYRRNFRQDMMQALPRFALTGFDHAVFFLRGLHKYGSTFDGAAGRFGYQPVQTPLKFKRVGEGGGYQNGAYMFIHYKPDRTIETVNY